MKFSLHRGNDTKNGRQGLLVALAMLGGLLGAGVAAAQVNGGSTNVRANPGFNCAPGTSWINDGGIARCQTPTAAAPFLASCPSLSNFQPSGACQFDIPATGAGVTVTAPTKTTTHIGQTTLTCNAGVWGPAATSCTPIPTLSVSPGPGTVYQGFDYIFSWTSSYATSITWSCAGANPSSGSLAASGSQALSTPNIGTTSCQVEATGPGGSSGVRTFNFYTDTRPGCPNTSYSAGACTYDILARPDGASGSFGNMTPGYSGSISASCSLGSWTFGASTCAPIPPANCSPQSLSASGCSFSFGSVVNGGSSTVGTTTPGYSGTASASCSNGALTLTGSSCAPVPPADCGAQVLSSGACSFSFGSVANGASSTVTNSVAGYTGTATASCSSGVLSFAAAPTCAAAAPSDCASTTRTSGSCSFTFGSISNGSSSTVSTSTPGYTGSATATCSSGAITLNGASCSPVAVPPANCSPSNTSSGACSYSVGALVSGDSQSVATSTPNYIGSATASCNNGTVSWSGASCTFNFAASCSGGQTWNGTACACPGGTVWNGASCVNSITGISMMGFMMYSGDDWDHPYLGTVIGATPDGLSCLQDNASGGPTACDATAWSWISADRAAIQNAFAPAFSALFAAMVDKSYFMGNPVWSWSRTIVSSTGKAVDMTLSSMLVCGPVCYYTSDVSITYR